MGECAYVRDPRRVVLVAAIVTILRTGSPEVVRESRPPSCLRHLQGALPLDCGQAVISPGTKVHSAAPYQMGT